MSPTSSPASTEPALSQLSEDHPAQAYGALPARELLNFVQIASSQTDDREAQTIYTAFYYRYFPYLYTVVSNSLGIVYDRDAQQEIIDDSLAAFFRASHKLTLPAAESDDGCDRIIRAYLGNLANWKASDARSFQKTFGQVVIDADELDARINRDALAGHDSHSPAKVEHDAPEKPHIQAVDQWMATLREVERDVLRTYFIDDHAGRKSRRLPDGVATLLATKHKTTTSNIRHLKSKLETQIQEKFQDL